MGTDTATWPARLRGDVLDALDSRLAPVDAWLKAAYPGRVAGRQPVHTVYVPADQFTADLPQAWGQQALATLEAHAPTTAALAASTGLDATLLTEIHPRLIGKLRTEPIEDLRIDFEDGYGAPGDEKEDATALAAARELAEAQARGSAPPFVGIRFKSLEAATRERGVRTLDGFLGALSRAGALPAGFVVTLPKVTAVAQVEAMTELCEWLERAHGLQQGQLRYEIQVETPQAVLAADGTSAIARMVHTAGDRLLGLHYGTYDYSAACDVAPAQQSMEHPVADHAKAIMQLAVAGTGVRLSDGSTNVLPTGDTERVRAAWLLHARLVTRSLKRAFYQGWDMHPGQLVTRYAATYAFFRAGFADASERFRAYLGVSGGSGVLDEPATAQALATFLLRGLHCGAIDGAEIEAAGMDQETLYALADREVR
ncbi:DUF6986 family protein [Haloechinothrix sp. LS1_15]|uniref:DUF6986 family protein n=1 Tax=Haloechinothrix sp. LS1_15 TaxID=2652248 RepID=UPI002947EBD9|nr:aldolase [Haloechinothrix sp. LS1_15]MDV6012824.1 aldolase [Haloechinothrix sp. LS1_15]